MANHCDNILRITGPERLVKIAYDKATKEMEEGKESLLFDWLVGKQDSDDVYQPWGTKWISIDGVAPIEDDGDSKVVQIEFTSAWSPPVDGYYLIEKVHPDLHIEATWNEYGQQFCGRFTTEGGTDDYEYGDGEISGIPEDIREMFGIIHALEMDNFADPSETRVQEE